MEGIMSTMDANDEKINGVVQNADKLADEDHYNADKVPGADAIWITCCDVMLWAPLCRSMIHFACFAIDNKLIKNYHRQFL